MNRFGLILGTVIVGASVAGTISHQPTESIPFKPLTWNADQRDNQDGSLTTTFATGWVNYLAEDGWKQIRPEFTETDTAFVITEAPYRFTAEKTLGTFTFENANRFDPETRTEITADPISKTKIFPESNPVEGQITNEGLLYEGAFPYGDLLVTATQESVSYVVVIRENPGTELRIPFVQQLPDGAKATNKEGTLSLSTQKDTGSGFSLSVGGREFFTRAAHVWDSSGLIRPISVLTKKTGNTLRSIKVIPQDFLKHSTYPVYTDAVDAFTADASDRGIVSDGGASWANTRNGAGSLALESLTRTEHFVVAYRYDASNYAAYRAFMWWDTGPTIPSGNTITAATLTVFFDATHAAESRSMYLVENRQATDTIATTDFVRIGASGVGTGVGQPFATITRGVSEASGFETFTLNADGLAKIVKGSGHTYFTVVESNDWDNVTPGSESTTGAEFNSGDAGSSKPTLSVTHAAPESPNIRREFFFF